MSRRSRRRRSRDEYDGTGDPFIFGLAKLPRAVRMVDELRTLADEEFSLVEERPDYRVSVGERVLQRDPRRFSSRGGPLVARLVMDAPDRVLFCMRRKIRREVLFAMNRAGFGGSARKRFWDRTEDSQYGC